MLKLERKLNGNPNWFFSSASPFLFLQTPIKSLLWFPTTAAAEAAAAASAAEKSH